MIVLYTRVSHKDSSLSGISIEEQVSQGLAYALQNIPQDVLSSKSFGSDTPGVFADKAVSGWSKTLTARPAGSFMHGLLKNGDHVVCYSIDRMARNMRDFANTTWLWMSMGVNVHYVNDQINTATATGKLQAHIRAAQAQFSSDLASERIREALAIKRMREGLEPCVGKIAKRIWVPSEYTSKDSPQSGRATGIVYRYERVSTDAQYTSGLSLEHQSRANLAYAQRHAVAIGSELGPAFVEDAISSFKVDFNKRPKGKELMKLLKPGDDIVIYRADRIWRQTRDAATMCEELDRRGVYIHLVNEGIRTDAGDGKLWINLLASMAELESAFKSRRVLENNAKLRKAGRPVGNPRKGYTVKEVAGGKSKLALDKKAAAVIAAITIMRDQMKLDWNAINDVLTAWKCQKKGKRATLYEYRAHMRAIEGYNQAVSLRNDMPEDVWNSILLMAWDKLMQSIEPKFWIVPTWDYMKVIRERSVG